MKFIHLLEPSYCLQLSQLELKFTGKTRLRLKAQLSNHRHLTSSSQSWYGGRASTSYKGPQLYLSYLSFFFFFFFQHQAPRHHLNPWTTVLSYIVSNKCAFSAKLGGRSICGFFSIIARLLENKETEHRYFGPICICSKNKIFLDTISNNQWWN